MKTRIIFITGFFLLGLLQNSMAQCDNSLVEKAIAGVEEDQVFIREFKVKLGKSTPKKPEPVAKYTMYLQSGIHYFLSIENSVTNKSSAILQVYKNDELILSNLNVATKTVSNQINFICEETGKYRMHVSFIERQEGCAVAVLSMRLDERKGEVTKSEEAMGVIYAGIENPISIYTDAKPGYTIQNEISRGILYEKDNEYYIVVDDTGMIEINTVIKDKNDQMIEEAITRLMVKIMPEPEVLFKGMSGGLIYKSNIDINDHLEIIGVNDLSLDDFQIIQFKIGRELNDFNFSRSYDNSLTHKQFQFIQELNNGEKFYIYDIKVKGPDNKIYYPDPMGFIIYH